MGGSPQMPNQKIKGAKGMPKKFDNPENACYVLITCGQPSKDGTMQVEMTYEGDPTLAAYLLESAQGFFDEEEL